MEREAREVIAEHAARIAWGDYVTWPPNTASGYEIATKPYDWADAILAALEAEGLRVVRLEQVEWSDAYMMGMAATVWLDEDEEPPPPSLFRIVSDPISPPQEGTE